MADEDEVPAEIEEDEPDLDDADIDEDDLVDADIDETLVLADDTLDDADAVEVVVDEEEEDAEAAPERPARAAAAAGDDDEDEPDPDDVEADLDTILKDRIAANDDEEEEDEEEQPPGRADTTDGDGANRVAPRKAGEFVCSSCFLVKPNSQLANAKKKLCLDCV